MMWLKLKEDGTPDVEGVTKPYCYHIDQFCELQPIIHKVIEYGQALGLDMIQGDHEDAPGQIELNFNFDRAEQTADNLSTFRQICRQVGRELGVFPCFMPKPFMGVSANGCHHNISLWRGDENAFMPETDDPQKPSQIGLWAIGGILEHLGALTAVTASTVNSYRRLWDTGFWAPVFADWGFQNRTTALRVSAPGRFEYRSVDSAVNPYLSMAALIKAMRDGIERKLDPGEPEERNIYAGDGGGQAGQEDPDDLRRRARRARGGRGRQEGPARRDVQRLHALQARRVGALLRHRHRLGRQGVPRRAPLMTKRNLKCAESQESSTGTVTHPIGDGDDPDAPVDEAPRPGLDRLRALRPAVERQRVIMRYKLADANTPRDFEYEDRLRRHRAEVERRLGALGADIEELRRRPSTPSASRSHYDGDLKKLADYVEDVPDCEVLSLGHSLEIVKDLGDAETVASGTT